MKNILTIEQATKLKNEWIRDNTWSYKRDDALMLDARDLLGSDEEFGGFDEYTNDYGWYQCHNRESLGLIESDDHKWRFSWISYNQTGDIADFFRFYYFSKLNSAGRVVFEIGSGQAFVYFVVFATLWQEKQFNYEGDSFYKDIEQNKATRRTKIKRNEELRSKTLEEALEKLGVTNDMKSTFHYLTQERCIDYELVKRLVETGHIRATKKEIQTSYINQFNQEKYTSYTARNTLFRFLDKEGNITGASETNNTKTYNKRLKRSVHNKYITEHSTFLDGFNFVEGDRNNVELVIFTEGAEDLLSFYCLYNSRFKKYKGVHFVAMMGKREATIDTYIHKYGTSINYTLAPDNADDAIVFSNKVKSKHSFINIFIPKKHKDWSEQLQEVKKK